MKKEFIQFINQVTQRLRECLGEGYQVERKDTKGLNGTVKHSLMLIRQGRDIHPSVNLDTYYNLFQSGTDMESLIKNMLKSCMEDSPVSLSEIADFTDWENVKTHIYAKLINTRKNCLLLSQIPNRSCMDLSLVYYVRTESLFSNEYAVIQISNEHMNYWGVNEEMLYQSAWKNLKKPDEAIFEDMTDILSPLLMEGAGKAFAGEEVVMYVLSNRYRANGAVHMCNRTALREASEWAGDDFWILPSSVHEVILIPVRQTEGCAEGLAGIVKEINDTQLEPQEILSYHVYRYSRRTGEITIAA